MCVIPPYPIYRQGVPTVLPSATFDGSGVHALHAMPPSLKGVVDEAVQGRADVSRVWAEWEHWRVREETAFAKRLREKVSTSAVGGQVLANDVPFGAWANI